MLLRQLLAQQHGDNVVDNVEKIEINAPEPGEYIVRVSHKGQLLVNDTSSIFFGYRRYLQ